MNNSTYSQITHNPAKVRYTPAMKLNKYSKPNVPGYEYIGFGKALHWYRKRAGMTQAELAEKSGLIHAGKQVGGRISNYENRPDNIGAPNSDYDLMLLADALGVEPDILVAGLIPTAQKRSEDIDAQLMRLIKEKHPSAVPEEALGVLNEFADLSLEYQHKLHTVARIWRMEEQGLLDTNTKSPPRKPTPLPLNPDTGGDGTDKAMGE